MPLPVSSSGAETQIFSVFLLQFQQGICIPFEDRQAIVANVFSLFFSQTLAAERTESLSFFDYLHVFHPLVNNSATDMPVFQP